MPKKNIDYSKIIIYKLVHKDDINNENIYMGYTTNFISRKTSHKNGCNNSINKYYNLEKYVFIRENGGWDMWNMEEIEKYPCLDANEASARQRYWFEIIKKNLK